MLVEFDGVELDHLRKTIEFDRNRRVLTNREQKYHRVWQNQEQSLDTKTSYKDKISYCFGNC